MLEESRKTPITSQRSGFAGCIIGTGWWLLLQRLTAWRRAWRSIPPPPGAVSAHHSRVFVRRRREWRDSRDRAPVTGRAGDLHLQRPTGSAPQGSRLASGYPRRARPAWGHPTTSPLFWAPDLVRHSLLLLRLAGWPRLASSTGGSRAHARRPVASAQLPPSQDAVGRWP